MSYEKTALWVTERSYVGTAVVCVCVCQLTVTEKREQQTAAGTSVSILENMSIETV